MTGGPDVIWWPVTASHFAAKVDWLFAALILVGSMLSVPPLVALVYLVAKYRYDRDVDRTHPPRREVWLEAGWTIVPFLLMLGLFTWAARLYYDEENMPAHGLEISVVAKQWMFKFQHPGGQRELDELHVPVNQVVKLTMISQDVIHDVYIPALRIKQDVLPGRTTGLWFKADRVGTYKLNCAEYCGAFHSLMGKRVVVMTQKDYQAWLHQAETDVGLAADGARLFRSLGCSGCHLGKGPVHAPPLAGVYGSPVPLSDGSFVLADGAYIRDSILQPAKQIVAGYSNDMPSFAGRVSEGDLQRLVAYVQSLAMENVGNAVCSTPSAGQ